MSFNICVVGLGLIGGSLAKGLRGFKNATIIGVDTDSKVCCDALNDKAVDFAYSDGKEALSNADLTILCLYPKACVEFVQKHSIYFKKGSLLTDAAGIKQSVQQELQNAVEEVTYIGGHPMAGKEKGGYSNSDGKLFINAKYIITPPKDAAEEHIKLFEEISNHLGCSNLVITTAAHHDDMIAYTSQLMHVVAVALCDNKYMSEAVDYSAGSFRDCTRVAVINENLWSELFIENKNSLVSRIEEFEESINKYKQAIINDDTEELKKLFKRATKQKLTYLAN